MDRVGRGQVGVHPLANNVAIRSQGRDEQQGQAELAVEPSGTNFGDDKPMGGAAHTGHLKLDQVAADNDSGRLGVAQAGRACVVPLALHRRARAPRPQRAGRRAAVLRREARSCASGWPSPHRCRRRTHRRGRRPRQRRSPGHRRLPRRCPYSRRRAVRRRLHGRLDGRAVAPAAAAGSCSPDLPGVSREIPRPPEHWWKTWLVPECGRRLGGHRTAAGLCRGPLVEDLACPRCCRGKSAGSLPRLMDNRCPMLRDRCPRPDPPPLHQLHRSVHG